MPIHRKGAETDNNSGWRDINLWSPHLSRVCLEMTWINLPNITNHWSDPQRVKLPMEEHKLHQPIAELMKG